MSRKLEYTNLIAKHSMGLYILSTWNHQAVKKQLSSTVSYSQEGWVSMWVCLPDIVISAELTTDRNKMRKFEESIRIICSRRRDILPCNEG